MNMFVARFKRPAGGTDSQVCIAERTFQRTIVRVHPRPNYTMTEAAQTAAWLNERELGYPRNSNLDHLYNGRG